MDLLFAFVVGVLSGSVLTIVYILTKTKTVGNLRVDNSDPDGTNLFLELETQPNALSDCIYVKLKVVKKNYISQK